MSGVNQKNIGEMGKTKTLHSEYCKQYYPFLNLRNLPDLLQKQSQQVVSYVA